MSAQSRRSPVRYKPLRTALNAIALFVSFQLAVSASALVYPGYERASDSLSERLHWFATWIATADCYVNPFALFFVCLASMKWFLVDRRKKISPVASAAYYVGFGLYYGALFMNGLNGQLHAKFDQALGVNPGPLV